MKLEWVNQGKEFKPEKINVRMELEILKYLEDNTNEMGQTEKNIMEFVETIYMALNKIDKNITRETVKENLTMNELGVLFTALRSEGQVKYSCPHCHKKFTYNDMFAEGDKNFRQRKTDHPTAAPG
jgi:peptide subunit release factor 1 (eRF1)